ncbi:hypothetical protein [Phenylobacterium sp. J367]|nr:hypothetical protein [Phenylobacterium sp. J367]
MTKPVAIAAKAAGQTPVAAVCALGMPMMTIITTRTGRRRASA